MRHLLDTRTLAKDDAMLILDTAEDMAATQQREVKKLPTLRGKQKARKTAVPVWAATEIGIDAANLGLNGSPTRVVRIEMPKVTRGGKIVPAPDEESAVRAVDGLVDFLKSKDFI